MRVAITSLFLCCVVLSAEIWFGLVSFLVSVECLTASLMALLVPYEALIFGNSILKGKS